MLDSKFPICKALDLFMLLSLEASDTETVIQHLFWMNRWMSEWIHYSESKLLGSPCRESYHNYEILSDFYAGRKNR